MSFNQHMAEFGGLPVVDFLSQDTTEEDDLPKLNGPIGFDHHTKATAAAKTDPGAYAWRLRVVSFEPEEEFAPYFTRFLAEVDTAPITALVLGITASSETEPCYLEARDLLIEHRDRFPNLRSLFLGDVVFEECEVSWLSQTDLGPLLTAFPGLVELGSRGTGEGYRNPKLPVPSDTALHLRLPEHRSLQRLIVQGGGLPALVCRELDAARLPSLEHLELWLGVDEYGGDSSPPTSPEPSPQRPSPACAPSACATPSTPTTGWPPWPRPP